VVREAGDGVARIEGLSEVMLNEMIEFPSGDFGLALNLEETEVGVILLGDPTKVSEGDEVKTTGRLLQVPVGKALLGRVVNTLGQPVDNKGPINTDTFYPGRKNRARALSSDGALASPSRPASWRSTPWSRSVVASAS
jgi:F-type H+-transporting ATPase subunit alpha